MKSLAAAALSMSLGLAGADAMASEPDRHAANHILVGGEASAHYRAFQAKYLRGLGFGFEAGAALSTGLTTGKDMLFGAEGVFAYQKEVTNDVGAVLELSAGLEAIKNSVHDVYFSPVAKGALLGELGVAENTKVYAGPYVALRSGHAAYVGGVAGLAIDF